MGLRWLKQPKEDPLVFQTGHRDDRNSPKCIIGKVQIIKDGNNFCLSCLEEQRLVALLQGSVESDDSPASGGDEEEGEQVQADNFTEVIKPGKAIYGFDTEKLLNCRTCGLHHLIFLLHVKQVFCYW